ncbi:hypothetical protein [Paraburkholderia unamae]|uniref:Uncharacterized protein n=1 Tax=Paraburkholderia unamae TaxID=219649 RepID=A0ABX5KCS5_9BURK|nr:hypothetical protein [Paraburkholderia unamae]PVX61370.1 hypothetical protein C7402_14019 [Paraburkholderia unamae]RAR49298.1 hypothetical protein C7401_14619 [Paraburkholderia unamae]
MKPHYYLISTFVSVTLATSGAALAQGSGGGSSSTGPGDATGGASGVYPSQAQGAEQNPAVTGSKSKSSAHHKKHAKKTMNDTINTPGADASSDTKGQ